MVSVLKIRLDKCRYVGQLLLKLAEIQYIANPLAKYYLTCDIPVHVSSRPFSLSLFLIFIIFIIMYIALSTICFETKCSYLECPVTWIRWTSLSCKFTVLSGEYGVCILFPFSSKSDFLMREMQNPHFINKSQILTRWQFSKWFLWNRSKWPTSNLNFLLIKLHKIYSYCRFVFIVQNGS